MCAVCRERGEKESFFRVVRPAGGTEGEARIDPAGRMPGRGAYVCKREKCIAGAQKTKVLARCLGCSVPAGLYEEMKRTLDVL